MEWTKAIIDAIDYIEKHILDDVKVEDVAKYVNISSYYFQKGFSILCGYSVAEYIKNRRLALAADEVIHTKQSIMDISLKYYYDSPDSFTKAFTRFHGITPSFARKSGGVIKSFLPLEIKISLEGGKIMNYKIEKKESFKVIAKGKMFTFENSKKAIPEFWDEHYQNGGGKVVCGVYGVCIDEINEKGEFEYLIADEYNGQDVPEGYTVKSIPSFTWAIFPCVGPLPDTLQNVNGLIFSKWLPSSKEYELDGKYCIEMYDDARKYDKGTIDEKYYCEIWIPVRKK